MSAKRRAATSPTLSPVWPVASISGRRRCVACATRTEHVLAAARGSEHQSHIFFERVLLQHWRCRGQGAAQGRAPRVFDLSRSSEDPLWKGALDLENGATRKRAAVDSSCNCRDRYAKRSRGRRAGARTTWPLRCSSPLRGQESSTSPNGTRSSDPSFHCAKNTLLLPGVGVGVGGA